MIIGHIHYTDGEQGELRFTNSFKKSSLSEGVVCADIMKDLLYDAEKNYEKARNKMVADFEESRWKALSKDQKPLDSALSRVIYIKEYLGKNTKQFAEKIGLTAPALHNMKARESRINKTLAYAIEQQTGFSAKWILTGEGARLASPNKLLEDETVLEVKIAIKGMEDRPNHYEIIEAKLLRE